MLIFIFFLLLIFMFYLQLLEISIFFSFDQVGSLAPSVGAVVFSPPSWPSLWPPQTITAPRSNGVTSSERAYEWSLLRACHRNSQQGPHLQTRQWWASTGMRARHWSLMATARSSSWWSLQQSTSGRLQWGEGRGQLSFINLGFILNVLKGIFHANSTGKPYQRINKKPKN